MRYSLSDGGVIEAGPKLGEGGEGVVFEALDGQRAIKLYHKPLAGAAADKLRAMVLADTMGLGAQAAWPLALIAGGAAGNQIDRVRFGAVIDFLDFYIGNYHWPAFNVADSAICIGMTILVYHIVFNKLPDF